MESGLGFIDKYELTLTCIMFNFLFKICITDGGYSSLFVETELPIFYGMEVANETTASSPLLCSLECLKIGCVGFLFKTDDIMDEASCHPNVNSSSYNGTLAITANGNICQNWADQTPHQHNTIARRMPESSLTEARNYCRDPKPISAGFTWCYTMNPNARWEPCNPCTSGNMTCRLFSTRNTTHGTSEYREGYRYFNRTSYHTFT
ncbi:hypothetical protein ACF0H5_008585 [Mactra antiquata]